MMYSLPSIAVLIPSLQAGEDGLVRCTRADFEKLLYLVLQHVPFDEEWYLSQYPDVRKAIQAGIISSGADHYRRSGYIEGRFPFEPVIDESWYCKQYPDVNDAINSGAIPDARTHYLTVGRFEGRLPCRIPVDANWYRAAYPKAQLRLNRQDSISEEDDFIKFGHLEGFQPFRPATR
jgi:hypothetical protein